jgi:2-polyprenyl-6-methoxyphenol hydroxylase-like FAD-dependent oxidoreductase
VHSDTSPFAGQGLNMGIIDASNLAFKLHLVVSGRAGAGLLGTYQE